MHKLYTRIELNRKNLNAVGCYRVVVRVCVPYLHEGYKKESLFELKDIWSDTYVHKDKNLIYWEA